MDKPAHPSVEQQSDLLMAHHLIQHQLVSERQHHIDDPAVQHWHQACGTLGGDMLAVCRAPNGVLHVMLADARSHGLSAYVKLLPIIAPFYRMTEKGFPLGTIARELNAKVRQSLPKDFMVGAELVAVDSREGLLSVWNGGMPNAFLLDGFGQRCREFQESRAALGMCDDVAFDDRVEQHAFSPGEQLVLASDGLLQACDAQGRSFGVSGLALGMVGFPRRKRLAEAVAAIQGHLSGLACTDDMSLVLIDCEMVGAALVAESPLPAFERHPGNWRFSLQLGANELAHVDVVPLLLNVAEQFGTIRERSGELFVILSELFNNALDHGVLRMDSELKLAPDRMEHWLRIREERLALLERGEVELAVEQVTQSGQTWLHIRCRDSGPGFDVQAALEKSEHRAKAGHLSALPFGRGLALVRHMAQDFGFNEAGNEIRVKLLLEGAPG